MNPFIVFVSLLMSLVCQAAPVLGPPLVNIQSEAYPNETYTIGFVLDNAGKKSGIYYSDPYQSKEKDKLKTFSFEELSSKDVTSVLMNKLGRDVVKLSFDSPIMTVFYRYDARRDPWGTKRLKLNCIGSELNCTVSDPETGKVTNLLYVKAHYASGPFHFPVGVESIEVR